MAAEGGHKNLLKILLDSGADAFHIGAVKWGSYNKPSPWVLCL